MKIKKIIPMSERPKCIVDGCNKTGQHLGKYQWDGTPLFRDRCHKHHMEYHANLEGQTVEQWYNGFHPYRKYRKDYCENKDGRLGFKCKYKIQIKAQLQVDHMNGNPTDHREENLQTLCANCHVYKTLFNKDYESPGRKYFKYS